MVGGAVMDAYSCSHKNLLAAEHAFDSGAFMSKNIHSRHGENIHRMEKIPEGKARGESGDLSTGIGDGLPPSEVKRIKRESEKRQAKKQDNQAKSRSQ